MQIVIVNEKPVYLISLKIYSCVTISTVHAVLLMHGSNYKLAFERILLAITSGVSIIAVTEISLTSSLLKRDNYSSKELLLYSIQLWFWLFVGVEKQYW